MLLWTIWSEPKSIGDVVVPDVNASRQATVVSVTPAGKAVGDLYLWPWAFVALLESRRDCLFRISDG